MGLAGLPPVTTIPALPFSVPAGAESLVLSMKSAVRCLMYDRQGMASSWEPGGARLLVCTLQLLDFSKGRGRGRAIGALYASTGSELQAITWTADREHDLLGQWREGVARICLLG